MNPRRIAGVVVALAVIAGLPGVATSQTAEEKVAAAKALAAELLEQAERLKQESPPSKPAKPQLIPVARGPVDPAALDDEIALIEAQLIVDQAEYDKYAGGLVKTLIAVRMETLKNTKVMLEQRRLATDYNVTINYNYHEACAPPAPDPQTIAAIESNIQEQEARLLLAEKKNERYSGGLVKAMILSEIATTKNTIAMLEQRRLVLLYGLPNALPQPGESSGGRSGAGRPAPLDNLEILDINTKVTESNDSWWKYAWKLTVRNHGDSDVVIRARIEFTDEDGFIIDDDTELGLGLPAGQQRDFTGYTLVDADVARNVEGVRAKISLQ